MRSPQVSLEDAEQADHQPGRFYQIPAHGGHLVDRIASPAEADRWLDQAARLPSLALSRREHSDLEMIAVGAFSPLEGFMGEADYRSVLSQMRLANGLVWSLPVTLSAGAEQAETLETGQPVALRDPAGQICGLLHLQEKYGYRKLEEAELVYRTTDQAHPGVAALLDQGEVLLGGPITLLRRQPAPDFAQWRLDPAQTREAFRRLGWRRVVGFQTRNPVHRAHEYLQKCALETVDGLLLHPLVGETKSDDIPPEVRMRCYQVLLADYYPADRVLLSVLPAAMRYAGPREAIFHALIRKNYGCTHFIVGRDHAGVGNYYGTYDAHRIFDGFQPEELGIEPMFFDHAFYCRRCAGTATSKTCPHPSQDHVALSGTAVRQMLRDGVMPPVEFTRPEVARVLIEWMMQA